MAWEGTTEQKWWKSRARKQTCYDHDDGGEVEEAGDEGGELSINQNGTQMAQKEQKPNNQKETIKKHLIQD